MGLPKIERDADADKGPYAVILAPTRELAQQVSWSIRPQASRHKGLMSTHQVTCDQAIIFFFGRGKKKIA